MALRPVFIALLLALAFPAVASADSDTRIIVKRDAGLTAAERADIRTDADVRLVETLSLPRTEVVVAEPGDVADAVRDLNADPDVVYAERDRRRTVASADTHYSELWAIPLIGANAAWLLQDGALHDISGAGQLVAVVDSGIDSAHPELVNQIDSAVNFVDEDGSSTSDGDGHGTHVSGTIAAERDNSKGIAGIAPLAQIVALRALDDDGGGFDSDIAEAFTYAGTHNIPVVNASLGGKTESLTLQNAIQNSPNTLFVVAAGNSGDDNDVRPVYPCNTPEPNVLCVGATDSHDHVADFSNYGSRAVDVFAPGTSILSTLPLAMTDYHWQGPYARAEGTSMAAPHVSGVAALVLQAAPGLSPRQLKEILLTAATNSAEYDLTVSNGRLNALAAVQLALAGTPLIDSDGDGWADDADACPAEAFVTSDGCAVDDDWDRTPDSADNCVGVSNPSQSNLDGDSLGDACDPDIDNDGIANASDRCALTPGPASHRGCPPPDPTPALPPTAPAADADGDGRADASDGCPKESAASKDGCPLPQVAEVSAKAHRRSATVKVTATRLSTLKITVERKTGGRWVRVARRTTAGRRATLSLSHLERGAHRVRISISSSAGAGTSVSKTFRVR